MTFCKLRWLEVQANDISGYKSSLVLGKDWGKGGPFSSVFYKLSDQCKSSRGMASWLAEPFFLLSLSVAAAAPVKNHFLLLNPKRAIPVGKISSKHFLYFLSFARKKNPFCPFCSSRFLLLCCLFWFHLVFSGSPSLSLKFPMALPSEPPAASLRFLLGAPNFFFVFFREGFNKKKKRFLSGIARITYPPPHDPNLGNLVLFFRTSKFKIWKSV